MPFIKTGRGQSLGVIEPSPADKPVIKKQSGSEDSESESGAKDSEAK